jgi:solute carrier family 25 (adenine nucleotide translocator) protein 4/5/6/31
MSGVSASISKTVASPIEVVKIRLQLQPALTEKGVLNKAYDGLIDCFRRIYYE